jgi:hypothetical protein
MAGRVLCGLSGGFIRTFNFGYLQTLQFPVIRTFAVVKFANLGSVIKWRNNVNIAIVARSWQAIDTSYFRYLFL